MPFLIRKENKFLKKIIEVRRSCFLPPSCKRSIFKSLLANLKRNWWCWPVGSDALDSSDTRGISPPGLPLLLLPVCIFNHGCSSVRRSLWFSNSLYLQHCVVLHVIQFAIVESKHADWRRSQPSLQGWAQGLG